MSSQQDASAHLGVKRGYEINAGNGILPDNAGKMLLGYLCIQAREGGDNVVASQLNAI
jgi:hypothetical protein